MEPHALIPFIVASVLLTFAPGPDIIFVATQSMAQGARAGIAVASGLCTGILFHIALAAAGISLILHRSPLAYNAVKLAGTIYLFWLAFQAFRHRNDPPISGNDDAAAKTQFRRLYRTGSFMSMLNPKVALFFLAFLPQFVPADAPHPWKNFLALGAIFDVQAFVVFVFVSICAGTLFRTLRTRPSVAKAMNILTALVLATIGLSLFFL